MTRSELAAYLSAHGFHPSTFSLSDPNADEAYVLAPHGRGWTVYYNERNRRLHERHFPDEAAACAHLLALLEKDPTTRA